MLRAMIAAALSLGMVAAATSDAPAQQSQRVSQKTVGPWSLTGFINPQGAPYCVAARVVGETNIMFARFKEGYGLGVQSHNFWLTRGSSVQVRVVAASIGDNTVEGKAVTTNVILARLTTDPVVMRRMAGLPNIVVTAEGQTVTIPLDGFTEALAELDTCLAQRGQMGTPSEAPAAPTISPAPQTPPAPGGTPAAPTQRLQIPRETDKRPLPIFNIEKEGSITLAH
jgi:hypothetical protein